jgi:N-acetylglutamate synthase-like GNAT family acetyltransferase
MMIRFPIERHDSLSGCLQALHKLLDQCYPAPPRDVFYRLVDQYHPGFPAWIARAEEGQIIGFVHLAPNSKGGTLETLAVHPDFRGQGLAQALVQRLLEETIGVVTLTTRIPDFFAAFGFEPVRRLPDGSLFMIRIDAEPSDHAPAGDDA